MYLLLHFYVIIKSMKHRDLSNYYKKKGFYRKKLFAIEKASRHHCVKDVLCDKVFFSRCKIIRIA